VKVCVYVEGPSDRLAMEALLLAPPKGLAARLGTRPVRITWRAPVEGRNDEARLRRVVEKFFAEHGEKHNDAVDRTAGHGSREIAVDLAVSIYWATRKQSALPAQLILGDLSIVSNANAVCSLAGRLQVDLDSGARGALVPIESNRSFSDVSADIVERVDPVFYGDPLTAAMKALGAS